MIVYAREGASFLVRNGDSVWKIFLEGHNWDFPAAADVGNEAKGNSAAAALWNAGHMSQQRGEETAQGQWGISEYNRDRHNLANPSKKGIKCFYFLIVKAKRWEDESHGFL